MFYVNNVYFRNKKLFDQRFKKNYYLGAWYGIANFRWFSYKDCLPNFFHPFLGTPIVLYLPKHIFQRLKIIYYLRAWYEIADFRTFLYKGCLPNFFHPFLETPIVLYLPRLIFQRLKIIFCKIGTKVVLRAPVERL